MSTHELSTSPDDHQPPLVHESVEIAASPERVFRALIDPRELEAWWGSAESYRTRDWKSDPRPGGAWSARTTDRTGQEGRLHGQYVVVDEPRVLEQTWRASWDDFTPMTLRFELVPATVDGVPGTRLTVTHTGLGAAHGIFSCSAARAAGTLRWAELRASLARAVEVGKHQRRRLTTHLLPPSVYGRRRESWTGRHVVRTAT